MFSLNINKNFEARNSNIPYNEDKILKKIHDIELRIDSNITSYKYYQARLECISSENDCFNAYFEGTAEPNDSYGKALVMLLNLSAKIVTNPMKTGLVEKANKLRGYFCFPQIRTVISTSITI